MPKTNARKKVGPSTKRRGHYRSIIGKRRTLAIAGVILSILGGSAAVSRWAGPSTMIFGAKPAPVLSPMPLDAAHPSKEYIYAGGRLVATEEPTATPLPAPANLRATTVSSTQIQITWNSVPLAARYELQRSSNYGNPTDHGFVAIQSNLTGLSYTDTVASNAAYLYRVRAFDAPFPGGNPSQPSNLDLAIAFAFTEDPVVQLMTVKEVHVTQLRQAVDFARVASGLTAATWADPPPLAQVVNIKKIHIDQLRSNLDGARSALSLPAQTYTDPTIILSSTKVKAAHIQELRRLVKGYMTAIDNP